MNVRLVVITTLLLVGLLIGSASLKADEPSFAGPGRVTVAAYNLEWFTDVFDDPYTRDEVVPPKPRDKQEQLALAIRQMNPDVLAVVELENEGVLRAFNSELLAGMDYRFVASAITNSDRGQNLGVLSRLPIISITSHRFVPLTLPGQEPADDVAAQENSGKSDQKVADRADQADRRERSREGGWRFARDLMQVKLQVTPTQTMELMIVHLKSKAHSVDDPKSGKWRLAEAHGVKTIVSRILKQDPRTMVLVAGDFNDLPGSDPIRHLLSPMSSAGPAVLADLHASLPADQRITYLKPPYRTVGPVDYLMASPPLARRVVAGSCRVLSDERLLGGSDHAPVYATFDFSR